MTSQTRNVPELVTEHLIIRVLTVRDHSVRRVGYLGRHAPNRPYDEGPPTADGLGIEDFHALVARFAGWAATDETYVFGLFLRSDSAMAGIFDLSTYVRDERDWANIGYVVHNQFQGQGLAAEALRAVLTAAHSNLDFQRVEAAVRPNNSAAVATALASGMECEGIRKRFWLDPDGWADHAIYASVRGL